MLKEGFLGDCLSAPLEIFIWDPQTSFDTAWESVRSVPDGAMMYAGDMRFERVELRSLSLSPAKKQIQTRNGRHLNLCVETSPSMCSVMRLIINIMGRQ